MTERARQSADRRASEAPKESAQPKDALVVFVPSGRRGRFQVGESLLSAARSLGVDIDSVCGGRGICGRCQVSVSTGAFAKLGIVSEEAHLSPIGEVETDHAARTRLAPGRRLSCAARITDDLVIDVPPESQIHRQIVRKRAEAREVEIDPIIRLHYLELSAPTIDDQASDLRRLRSALEAQWGLTAVTCDHAALRGLPTAFRDGEWRVTVALRDARHVVAVWPGFRDQAFGLAVDVGTTTIAAHLCDLATGDVVASADAMNPQIRFGEDVMSRLSYIQAHPDHAGELMVAVREAIGRLAADAARAAGTDAGEILELSVVGNPTMHHILLGLDPRQLGRAPFALAVEEALEIRASDLDLPLHPGAHAYFLPCIAGHVGADTAGVLLSEAPHQSDEMTLIVDIGTNAEIVLGNRDRLLACSSPTGPAFEGAQISCGQRAAPGAIERVRIDRETLVPRFKVIGCDRWSDEPGFEDQTADIGVRGICGSGIVEAVAEMSLAGLITPSGLIDGSRQPSCPHLVSEGRVYAYRLHRGPPALHITQTDVRAIQLAKGALYAGAQLMMEHMGVTELDRILLAGAFGSYIDPKFALALGMIPDCDPAHISSAGNAAGTGARIALLNRACRGEIEKTVRRIEKLETAAETRFQDYFVAAMAIPHRDHPFPNLARAFATPGGVECSRKEAP